MPRPVESEPERKPSIITFARGLRDRLVGRRQAQTDDERLATPVEKSVQLEQTLVDFPTPHADDVAAARGSIVATVTGDIPLTTSEQDTTEATVGIQEVDTDFDRDLVLATLRNDMSDLVAADLEREFNHDLSIEQMQEQHPELQVLIEAIKQSLTEENREIITRLLDIALTRGAKFSNNLAVFINTSEEVLQKFVHFLVDLGYEIWQESLERCAQVLPPARTVSHPFVLVLGSEKSDRIRQMGKSTFLLPSLSKLLPRLGYLPFDENYEEFLEKREGVVEPLKSRIVLLIDEYGEDQWLTDKAARMLNKGFNVVKVAPPGEALSRATARMQKAIQSGEKRPTVIPVEITARQPSLDRYQQMDMLLPEKLRPIYRAILAEVQQVMPHIMCLGLARNILADLPVSMSYKENQFNPYLDLHLSEEETAQLQNIYYKNLQTQS